MIICQRSLNWRGNVKKKLLQKTGTISFAITKYLSGRFKQGGVHKLRLQEEVVVRYFRKVFNVNVYKVENVNTGE